MKYNWNFMNVFSFNFYVRHLYIYIYIYIYIHTQEGRSTSLWTLFFIKKMFYVLYVFWKLGEDFPILIKWYDWGGIFDYWKVTLIFDKACFDTDFDTNVYIVLTGTSITSKQKNWRVSCSLSEMSVVPL